MQSVLDHIKTLDADQARAVLFTVDTILGNVCGCDVHKAEGTPVPYEVEMAELLLGKWATATATAKRQAAEWLAARGGVLTADEMDDILDAIDDILDDRFFAQIKSPLRYLFDESYRHAKHGIAQRLEIVARFNVIDTEVTKWLTDHHLYWIHDYYNRRVSGQFAKVVAEGMAEGLGRNEMGVVVKDFFSKYPGLANKPDSYYRLLSANAMNRSRNFGIMQGFEDAGIESYRIVAVMDERTSPICRKMNNTVISVKQGIAHRNALMAAETPEDVKAIAPWPTPTQIETLDVDQLSGLGVKVPPFHGFCRSTIVAE
jgi:SPP1 gp7 family putative phage head morphogenesis protein